MAVALDWTKLTEDMPDELKSRVGPNEIVIHATHAATGAEIYRVVNKNTMQTVAIAATT